MPRGSRNYSLVINSRFRPFSYQEMLAPTMQATQAHQALEDAYGTLGMQAGTVEAMLNRDLDEKAYNQYQGYMQGLQESADLLAREGLNPALRGSLSNLKSRYSQEIVPIQKAAERREKLAEEQRKLGNNAIFDFNASTTGLDRFMDNPSLNYRYIDRMALLQEAQDQFSQFQKDLVSMAVDPNLYKDAFHNTVLTKYGFTPDEAAELTDQVAKGTANLDNISNEAVRRIAENLYNTTNVGSWNSEDASNRVWRTIAEGIKAGVGNETPQIVEDIKKHEDYKYRKELEKIDYANRKKKEEKEAQDKADAIAAGKALLNPLPLRNMKEISENNKRFNKWVDKKYIEYDKNTGSYYITSKGQQEMYKARGTTNNYMEHNTGGSAYYHGNLTTSGAAGLLSAMNHDPNSSVYKAEPTEFGKFVESLYGEELKPTINARTGNFTYNDITKMDRTKLNDYVNYNKADSYDTQHTTEFDIQLDDDYGKDVLRQMNTANGKNKFNVVEWSGDGWKTADMISFSDFGTGARVTNERIKYNPKTGKDESTYIVQNDKGDTWRVKAPAGINITQEANRAAAFYNADTYRRIVENGHMPMYVVDKDNDGNTRVRLDLSNGLQFTDVELTPEDLEFFKNAEDAAYINVNKYGMNIVKPAKTGTIDYNKITTQNTDEDDE